MILYHKISRESIEKKNKVLYTIVMKSESDTYEKGKHFQNGGDRDAGNKESDKGI